jgi:hypothetical protein
VLRTFIERVATAREHAMTSPQNHEDRDETSPETDRGRALEDLRVHLLEHLDYEERNAGPAMRRLDTLAVP